MASAEVAMKQVDVEGSKERYLQLIRDSLLQLSQNTHDLNRYDPKRIELYSKVGMLDEESRFLQKTGSCVGEVVKVIGKSKVLVKVHPEGKRVVDIAKCIDITKITPSTRVALRNDSYVLHFVLPRKVDPRVNLMNLIENPPDFSRAISCVLNKKTKETKEVIELPIKHPEVFESLRIAQPKEVESASNDNIIPGMNEDPIPPVDSRKSKKKEAASASSISSAAEDISAYAQRRQRYLDGKREKDQLAASLLAAQLDGAKFKNRQREMKFFYEPHDHITDPNHLEAVLADKREIGRKNGWKIYF